MSGMREAISGRYTSESPTNAHPEQSEEEKAWSDQDTDGAETKSPITAESLSKTIESEIIPRLLLIHKANASDALPPDPDSDGTLDTFTQTDVLEFAELVRLQDSEVASAYLDVLHTQGYSEEFLLLDLLAPTARHFGKMWEEDTADFMLVTLWLSKLQQTLRRFSQAHKPDKMPGENGHKALLIKTPGDQHTFGISIVAEFFRREGWDVYDDTMELEEDQLSIVGKEYFALVGLSLSSEVHIEKLAQSVRTIRSESLNRAVIIMVGGQLFVDHPELVAIVGADATATDGKESVREACNLMGLRSGPE